MQPSDMLSAAAFVLSILAATLWWLKRVVINVYNIDDREIKLKWCGKVIRNTLRLETDGDSVIVSDDLLPLHGREVTVIVLPKDL